MKVDILNFDRQTVGGLDLSDDIFGLTPRADILARVIHWQQAKKRQGTHAVKERGDVRGSTKKVGKQKGGGCARHGSKRGAQFRGGGIIFGPVVRDHGYSLPKKIRKLGLRMALSSKIKSGDLMILDSLDLPTFRTKDLLHQFKFLEGKKALLVDSETKDSNLARASSNIFHLHVLPQIGMNVYDIIKSDKVVFSVSAVKLLEDRLR